jgi:hypothetical protein
VHLPGWSYEPARDIAQATVHVVPHARSRGRKAPCWPWGSASRSSAPRSTAWHAPWARAAASWCRPRPPAPSPGRCRASWPASALTPPSAGPAPAVHPQRSGRGTGQRLPPAARQPRQSREARRAMALTTSAFWCGSWSWAAVLTEMAAPAGRQVTALPHSSERTAGPAPGTSASSRDDSRSARLPLVTARDGSSVRKGADPPSSCSSGYCYRSLAVAAQIGVICLVCEPVRGPRPPVWFLAGPVGHLSADRWQPASYRVPAVPRGLTRVADQRPGRPTQRSSLPVVRVSPVCLMSGCLWGAREMASRQGQSRRPLVPRRAWSEGVRG